MIFTARCYAALCRLSVCPSVTFRYRDRIGCQVGILPN